MRKKRAYLSDLQSYLNLDSLVDIVSNNVGILVILAVFMAAVSYTHLTLPTNREV